MAAFDLLIGRRWRRTGWWRRNACSGRAGRYGLVGKLAGHRYAVALAVHALHVGMVVTLLRSVAGAPGFAAADDGAGHRAAELAIRAGLIRRGA